MSTNTRAPETSIDADRFTAVTSPRQIAADDIPRMAEPDQLTDDAPRSMAFAVGVRPGVVHNVDARREYNATAVLYMTEDGERVVERWIAGGLTEAPRATIVADDRLDTVGLNAARLADALATHPEVDS
ncbi:hypothetical protein [Halobaculum sp. EA56]|uniref:hypothetical protein n=1 Tax=Halobaculum sp. EA56 TaxID=3421648 RepID=UPI003EBDC57B